MSLRRRISLVSAASVAMAILLASVIAYVAVRSELRSQVDDTLRERAGAAQTFTARIGAAGGDPSEIPAQAALPPGALEDAPRYLQLVGPGGTAIQPDVLEPAPFSIKVDPATADIAAAGEGETLTDQEVGGEHLRVLTVGIGQDGAVQIARSLESTDDVLSSLRVVLFLVVMGGAALGALLARVLAGRAIAPISRLTEAAEHIGKTEDLTRRIDLAGEDEVGRLAARFNAMLDTLARSRGQLADSVEAQRQLVADASHELRTPVASLRTDIEVLLDGRELEDGERTAMLRDIDGRIEELTALITDVIELARGEEAEAAREDVRLDLLAAEAVERARRHAPDRDITLEAAPTVVDARPDRVARALNNLLDNAIKFSPDGSPVEVGVGGGEVSVRDHGPGVPAAERRKVFDRFHRGPGSRRAPGSGLGLAIVRQVADAHGGVASVEEAEGGGARFRLGLPVVPGSITPPDPPEPDTAPRDPHATRA